jgi:peptide/nickel transport system ATP-binding protein
LNGFAIGPAGARKGVADKWLSQRGLSEAMPQRRSHDLSGGQCQHVGLAQALAAQPRLLLLDGPFSGLYLSTQLKANDLLKAVLQSTGVTMLIASDDLASLRNLASRVWILDGPQIVEDLPLDLFFEVATHPLTIAYARTLAFDRVLD